MNGDHMTFGGAKMSNGAHYEWSLLREMSGGYLPVFAEAYFTMTTGARYVIRNAVL